MKTKLVPLLAAVIGSLVLAAPAAASHSWNGYHWGRTANPFTLKLGDNVSGVWDSHLAKVSSDWSTSQVLDTSVVAGGAKNKQCRPQSGRVEVCNGSYGFNGWLGLAQIWLSGGHIVQGSAKVNDTYFNTSTYNDANARQHVLCQEIGHTFGLDHQMAQSCMDDRNGLFDPRYVSPNAHDFEQLETIYAHLDASSTVSAAPAGNGMHVLTVIFWAPRGASG